MENLNRCIDNLIRERSACNVAVKVGKNEQVLFETYRFADVAINEETLFDMASVTKILATTGICGGSAIAAIAPVIDADDKDVGDVNRFDCYPVYGGVNVSMDYLQKLNYHYKHKEGWINDPNGLVYFKGYYHIFYQHAPDFEIPWEQPMHWGHARTKDFLDWEELPVALFPDNDYDNNGCWSGTAIVKDDTLYLFYASVKGKEKTQTVSIAYSKDGIHFEKYAKNPVIASYPADGGPDFRDPAVCCIDGQYYCVMATGNPETKTGRLLLYKSENLFEWEYKGIMCQWENCKYAECPSFTEAENGLYLLTASVCTFERKHYFSVMYGEFEKGKFIIKHSAEVDKGPDQYAGQVFRDHLGRNILISWIPGWKYSGYAEKDVGCMSAARELKF